MEFLLPKLQTLLHKDLKMGDEDVRKYVHVINGHAVVSNGYIVCVNLREYIKLECEITDEEELDKLTEIVDWMEGKSFPIEYWKELTTKSFISLTSKGIEIESLNSSKILIYDDSICNITTLLNQLTSNLNKEPMEVDIFAVSPDSLLKILSCFKSESKGLSLVLRTTGQDTVTKFQFSKKDYIFGLIPTFYEASQDMYNFITMKDYHDECCQKLIE